MPLKSEHHLLLLISTPAQLQFSLSWATISLLNPPHAGICFARCRFFAHQFASFATVPPACYWTPMYSSGDSSSRPTGCTPESNTACYGTQLSLHQAFKETSVLDIIKGLAQTGWHLGACKTLNFPAAGNTCTQITSVSTKEHCVVELCHLKPNCRSEVESTLPLVICPISIRRFENGLTLKR